MSVGSAFDAHAKSYLYNALFGKKDPRFELVAIFEAQVEPQNRDKAFKDGLHCFEVYKKSGCLADLMLDLQKSITEPRFEFDIMGQVDGRREGVTRNLGPVPFLGKPDVYFTNAHGARVIVDWKVNGFYSNYAKSPMKGYVRMRDGMQNYGQHKDAFIQAWKGMKVNYAHKLESLDSSWARQLAIYGWLCGEEVGKEECLAGIDQLACAPDSVRAYPKIRIAEHRVFIGKDFQYATFDQAQEAWEVINSNHFFRTMPIIESQMRCEMLDKMRLDTEPADNDDWFQRMSMR